MAQGTSRDQQPGSTTSYERNATMVVKSGATGEQKNLFSNPFDFSTLKFPSSVGENDRFLHWVKFTANIQEKSSYQVQTTGASQADLNRASGQSGLAGTADAFTALGGAGIGAGLAVLSSAEALIDGGKNLLGADTAAEARRALIGTAGGVLGGVAGGFVGGFAVSAINLSRKTRRAAASINLYMPDTVTNTMVNDYDQVSLTEALGKAGLVGQAGESAIEGVKSAMTGGGFGLGGGGTSAGGLAEVGGIIAEKTGNFGAGITDVLLFSAGLALNPQVELLFKNIQNREFLFDYKFVARNAKDAATIREIIKKFRFYAAPEIPANSTGRYFIPPSEFDIEFMVGKQPNKNLPRISTCVLQGVDVNYGSAGQWTAFKDGMPVEISMQLRFKEVEIMHKKLIEDGF